MKTVFKILLFTLVLFGSNFNVNAEEFSVYEDTEHHIHIKHPKTWHVRVEDTRDSHAVFISREKIINPIDSFKVGISILQFHDIAKKLPLAFSNPDKAAQQWVDANTMEATYKKKLLDFKKINLTNGIAYYSEFISLVPEKADVQSIMLTRFYLQTFSSIVFESPIAEFSSIEKIYQEIINDKAFKF